MKTSDLNDFQNMCKDSWESSSCGLSLSDWYKMPKKLRAKILKSCDYGHRKIPWLPKLLKLVPDKE